MKTETWIGVHIFPASCQDKLAMFIKLDVDENII
jgi:hypothetical protein